jgi:hypothetical protein
MAQATPKVKTQVHLAPRQNFDRVSFEAYTVLTALPLS